SNTAYTLHYYAGTHRQDLRDKGDAALDKGLALLITEFGTVEATGDGPLDYAESGLGGRAEHRLDGLVHRRQGREQRCAQAGHEAVGMDGRGPDRIRQAAARQASRNGRH